MEKEKESQLHLERRFIRRSRWAQEVVVDLVVKQPLCCKRNQLRKVVVSEWLTLFSFVSCVKLTSNRWDEYTCFFKRTQFYICARTNRSLDTARFFGSLPQVLLVAHSLPAHTGCFSTARERKRKRGKERKNWDRDRAWNLKNKLIDFCAFRGRLTCRLAGFTGKLGANEHLLSKFQQQQQQWIKLQQYNYKWSAFAFSLSFYTFSHPLTLVVCLRSHNESPEVTH